MQRFSARREKRFQRGLIKHMVFTDLAGTVHRIQLGVLTHLRMWFNDEGIAYEVV